MTEIELQTRRQSQWANSTRTAPLLRRTENGFVTVENRVLSANGEHVKGLFKYHQTGRIDLFTISHNGCDRWYISQGEGNYLVLLPGSMKSDAHPEPAAASNVIQLFPKGKQP